MPSTFGILISSRITFRQPGSIPTGEFSPGENELERFLPIFDVYQVIGQVHLS